MTYIPDYTDEDFKSLVAEVMRLTKSRRYCSFLEGDFDRIKEARKKGDFNPSCLHNKILGVPLRDLPLHIHDFENTGKKDDKIAYYVVRWRLEIGK